MTEGSDTVPHTRWTVSWTSAASHARRTASWTRVALIVAVATVVLVGATSCSLFTKPPEGPSGPSVLAEGKPAPVFELQALGSTVPVRFPDAYKGKVVALEFFSTG